MTKEKKQLKKCIVLSGASKGIGLYLARYLLGRGYRVIGLSRSEGEVDDPYYQHMQVDLLNDEELKDATAVLRQRKDIFGLVNNAAVANINQIITTPDEAVRKIFKVNFEAAFQLSRELTKAMIHNNNGRIINISSQTVPLNTSLEAVYASSKAALETFTRIAAKEFAPFNITVNAVGPSVVETRLIKGINQRRIDDMLNLQAIKRPLELKEVAAPVGFLLSESASAITGQVIYLGGVNA